MLITANKSSRNVSIVSRLVENARVFTFVDYKLSANYFIRLSSALVNYSLQSDIRYTSLGGLVEANGILNPAWASKFALML